MGRAFAFWRTAQATAARLSAGVDDVATDNLASLHELVDLVELRETDSLEGDLDETAAEEVNGLSGISTVADVRSLDGDHANNCVEDGSRELSIGGETNADDSTARADVLGSLLEGLLVGSDEESSVRSETIGGGSLDISDKVLGCGKVDISSSSELLGELSLLLTTIDGNGVDTHGLAVLDSVEPRPPPAPTMAMD